MLETIPSKQNKEIEFFIAEEKHKLQVWNERVENNLIPKIFVKDGIAVVIDGIPVQNTLADPISKFNSGKAFIWLLTTLLFVKAFIIPLSSSQLFTQGEPTIFIFVNIILFILSLSAALTFQLNPIRATWIALVVSLLELTDYILTIVMIKEFGIVVILFTVLRLTILSSLILSLRNLKLILNFAEEEYQGLTEEPITRKKVKRFIFPLKYVLISIISLLILGGSYYIVNEIIKRSKYPSIERDSSLEYRTDLKLPDLIPYRRGDKWGYCDKNKNIIITPKYSGVGFIREESNRIIVNYNGLMGVIDTLGNKVIPFIYDKLFSTPEKDIYGAKRGKYGLIDANNNVVIPFKYESLFTSDSYIIGKRIINGINQQEILSLDGSLIKIFNYDSFWPLYENEDLYIVSKQKLSFMDYDLSFSFPAKYDGIIDKYGKVIVPLEYTLFESSHSKYITAKMLNPMDYYNSNRNVGLLDKSGKFIIPFKYDEIDLFVSTKQYLAVRIDDKWGVINLRDEIVIPIKYEYLRIDRRNDQHYFSAWLNEKVGLINELGEVVIPFEYSGLVFQYSEKLIPASLNGKYGAINFDNEIIIPFEYSNWLKYSEGMAASRVVNVEEKENILSSTNIVDSLFIDYLRVGLWPGMYGGGNDSKRIKDKPGFYLSYKDLKKKLLTPELRRKYYKYNREYLPGYKEYEKFALSVVLGHFWSEKLLGQWGYFNDLGELVIDFIYDEAESFSNDLANVKFNNKWGMINNKNQVVIAIKYDEALNKRRDFDIYDVELEGRRGYVDVNGVEYFENN